MSPETVSAAFATIIGLICNFRQERGATEALDHQKFIEWLEYHRHEEIKKLIVNTVGLRDEVDQILRVDHVAMLQKLDAISAGLATLLSRVPDFRGLVLSLNPQAELSEQAVFILRQLVNSKSKYFLFGKYSGDNIIFQLEEGELMGFYELRFIPDDLEQLVGMGLLMCEQKRDSQLFRITRNAVRFIEAIDGAKKSDGTV